MKGEYKAYSKKQTVYIDVVVKQSNWTPELLELRRVLSVRSR
jgi:hypothetical protein